LSKGNVSLRTAQAAMRHSDPSLTANVYTDPKLLDVRAALDVLPQLPLDESVPEQGKTGVSPSENAGKQVSPDCTPDCTRSRKSVSKTG
jgi:hypothetical protein